MKIAQVLNNLRLVFTQDFFFFKFDYPSWSFTVELHFKSEDVLKFEKKKWLKYMNKMIKNLYY